MDHVFRRFASVVDVVNDDEDDSSENKPCILFVCFRFKK